MIAEVTVRFRSLAIFNLTAIVVLNYQNDDFLFSREGMPRNPKQDANLIPTNKRSKSEVREIGQKGGIASGVARAKRSTLQSIARAIADAPAPDKLKAQIEKSGLAIGDEDMNGNAAVVAGVYRRAIQGEDKAVEKWESWTDVQTADEKQFYIPAYLMGKAFVDINRNIEPNKTYIFEGGRGGLKSSYVSLKVVELLKNNPTMHACVLRKVGGTLKDSVFSQIKWAIHALGLDDEFQCKTNPIEIVYKKTGQIIYFRGCDDPIKLKSIKPPFGYIGILWIEERDQLSGAEEERSVKQSVLRGGAPGGFGGSSEVTQGSSANTHSIIKLSGVEITDADGEGCFMRVCGNCAITSLTNNGTIDFNGYTITLADGSVLK